MKPKENYDDEEIEMLQALDAGMLKPVEDMA